ncbi:di-N-acetylchitobiase-like [Dreissena polymorpha]|uniref:Di-N-acetylchitobiase n=1 Tax=Dreissena polymorpha TaxID=45954 RepID=A0A9D4HJ44_DREPO|nr:di-N-acetylchitobiase-like [Dreissena polymorpha]XP_052246197.1 di-N-acetylchitobiase-like [Dreissena polymorpha]XP_052246198.1 di-N-acetylchitobiase-like [Dreissena polymorpha]KAH3719389.1 hypothetical protein DPMN_062221 [Dreissena polymorpha]
MDGRVVATGFALTLIGVVLGYVIFAPKGSDPTTNVCPCSEARFCERISDTTRKEIFIFSLTPKAQAWRFYDWTKVTTVVMVGYLDMELVCTAHKYGARAITIGDVSTDVLPDATKRAAWIQQQLAVADKYFLDGINFDYEDPISASQPEVRDGYTALVRETRAAFTTKYANSQVSVDVAWSPDCIDGRCYDYVGLSRVSDFLFVMAYDEQSQITGPCIAMANSGLSRAMSGIEDFLSLDIPADRLVLGVPWYGYDYTCLNVTKDNICSIKPVPFRGVYCSDAAGSQINYYSTIRLLPTSTTGRIFDQETQSPYFNYVNQGVTHQIRYDDPESLGIKYTYAVDQDLRGVGMWNSECVDYISQDARDIQAVREMWGALPVYKPQNIRRHQR